MPDQCELVFKLPLKFDSPDDYAMCVEFYLRARLIIVTTNLGQSIVITRDLKQQPALTSPLKVTRMHVYENKPG